MQTGRDAGSIFVWIMSEKNHATPALVCNEGILCTGCTVTDSYTIKLVALSIILT